METHGVPGYTDQRMFDLRCEWGAEGVATLAPAADVIVIVDVLSFTTCVSIAVERGASVIPYPFRGAGAEACAAAHHAILAVPRGQTMEERPYSLSPASLLTLPPKARLVLPSPNGSALTLHAAEYHKPILAGCLRNVTATASYAARHGRTVAVIPAGERWGSSDGPLRPAVEDWLGAGAILEALRGLWPTATLSPEAAAAVAAFADARWHISREITGCASGCELRERGYAADVDLAAALDVTAVAAVLSEGTFIAR